VVDGKRKQLRRRYRTEKEARAALAEVQGQVTAGTYVQPSTVTVEDACADWLRSRHKSDRLPPRATSTSSSRCGVNSANSLCRISRAAIACGP
jgi:hypothetical protein